MSVRKQKRKFNGKVREFWIVDIAHRHPNGTITRVRRVPRDQTRVGAERMEREIIRQLEQGTFGKKIVTNPTFAAFAKEFAKERLTPAHMRLSSIDQNKQLLKDVLLPYFGRMHLAAIDARVIDTFKAAQAEKGTKWKTPYSKKTINNHLILLRVMLRRAQKWGAIASVPEFKLFKAERRNIRFLDFDEKDAFMEALRDYPKWEALFCTALNTGMRIGELLALRWENVDLKRRSLTVSESVYKGKVGATKSGKIRPIPLNQELHASLKQHRHLRSQLVFCTDAGRLLEPSTCRRILRTICRAAKVKDVGLHDLRHTFASHLVMHGVPLKAVQELLGHANIEMTMIYSHLTPRFREDAVSKLDRGPDRQRPPGGNILEGQ